MNHTRVGRKVRIRSIDNRLAVGEVLYSDSSGIEIKYFTGSEIFIPYYNIDMISFISQKEYDLQVEEMKKQIELERSQMNKSKSTVQAPPEWVKEILKEGSEK